jgi:hypothetical protein
LITFPIVGSAAILFISAPARAYAPGRNLVINQNDPRMSALEPSAA